MTTDNRLGLGRVCPTRRDPSTQILLGLNGVSFWANFTYFPFITIRLCWFMKNTNGENDR